MPAVMLARPATLDQRGVLGIARVDTLQAISKLQKTIPLNGEWNIFGVYC